MSNSSAVEILLVEDNPQDLELTLRALKKANLANRIQVARDGAEALDFIFCEGQHASRRMDAYPKSSFSTSNCPRSTASKSFNA
ncbi:MAG: hypothetical protein QM760_14825 [Nibricoccus sp.]